MKETISNTSAGRQKYASFLAVWFRDSLEELSAVEATTDGNEEREAQKLCLAEKTHIVGLNLVNKNRASTSYMYFNYSKSPRTRDYFKNISDASEIREFT